MSSQEFKYHAFVLDKKRLFGPRFANPKSFYQFAVETVCENARGLLDDAKIVIDKHGDVPFKRQLERALKERMPNIAGRSLIRKVGMENSHSNNLVQLADMVCGATARCYNADHNQPDKFQRLIRNREARVSVWPK